MKGPIRKRVAALAHIFCRHDWEEIKTLYPPLEERTEKWPVGICVKCGKVKTT